MPVALETGYVEPYSESVGRKQVIVVVREDWTVSCFDTSLKLLWEKPISHKSHEMSTMANFYKIDDVAVYVAPLSLEEQSSGIVVVGAAMVPRDEEAAANALKLEEGLLGERGDIEHPELRFRAALEHYSVFALDAKDGHVIWRHDGAAVTQDQYIHSLPQHMFKEFKASISDLASFHQSRGLNDWSVFKQSLVSELPHVWRSKDDSTMRIAHFVRRHLGAGAGTQVGKKATSASSGLGKTEVKNGDSSLSVNNNKLNPARPPKVRPISEKKNYGFFTGIETDPLKNDAELPHDSSEHIDHPNVVVAHTKRGVEVLALQTGTPITALALNPGMTYADVDGDGVVDQLLLLEKPQDVASHGEAFAHDHGQLQHCTLMVVSGLPPRSQLFNGSLCMSHRHLHDPILSKHSGSARSLIPAEVSATAPVILKTLDERTKKISNYREIVVAVNTGVATCFDARGVQKWQVNGLPTWPATHKMHTLMAIDPDASRVDSSGTHDSIFSQLVLLGTRTMILLNRDGDVLATTELPNIPISRPVLGDFDSDGVTDLILITDDAILGYKINVVQSVRAIFIAVLVLIVIAAIVFFSNIRTNVSTAMESNGAADGTSPGPGFGNKAVPQSKKRSVLSLIRSTDDQHID
jgi:hypothetical protein